jgi:hypothetical protein
MSSIRSITRIEPGQFALMMAAIGALFGILFALLIFMFASIVPTGSPYAALGKGFTVILLPIFYGIGGYIFGLIEAFVYNLVAGTVGGIKVTVSD